MESVDQEYSSREYKSRFRELASIISLDYRIDLRSMCYGRKDDSDPNDESRYTLDDIIEIEKNLIETQSDYKEIKEIVEYIDEEYELGGYQLTCLKPIGVYEKNYNLNKNHNNEYLLKENIIFNINIGLCKEIKGTHVDKSLKKSTIYAVNDLCRMLESKGCEISMNTCPSSYGSRWEGESFDYFMKIEVIMK